MKLAVLALLVACNAPDRGPHWRPAGNTTPRDGGTLRFAVKDQIKLLDPTIEYDDISMIAVHALFDTLVGFAPAVAGDPASGLALVPHLAERYEVSPDATTFHFWLKSGIAYSDGTPIIAADFAYSLERALTTPDSPFTGMVTDIVGAADVKPGTHCAGITTPSDRELVIRLAHPQIAFLDVLTMPFSTPQRADHVAAAGDQLRREPLGTGPFTLASWSEGELLALRKNPSYWDAAHVHLDAIEIRENVPRETQFLMFERGDLDVVGQLTAPDYLWVIDQPAWAPYTFREVSMNTYGSRMNVGKPPFTDRRVRQAMNYAIDKDHELKLLNGAAVPAHGILPPGLFGRDDALAPYPHDPAKARALLAEAGYPNGFDVDYVILNDGIAEELGASLQHDLADVGVRVQLSEMSLAAWVTADGSPDGPPFCYASWLADYPDPTNFIDARFHSRMIAAESSANDAFYANPALDALLDAARGEIDPGKRAAMYRKAEHILYDDAPWVWGYHQMLTEVVQPYVKGFSPHPIWLLDHSAAWLDVGADGEPVAGRPRAAL